MRLEVGERAIELVAVAGILAGLQIFLDAGAGEQEHFPFALRFQLLGRQLPLLIFVAFCLMFCDLLFDGLTFPASGHVGIL